MECQRIKIGVKSWFKSSLDLIKHVRKLIVIIIYDFRTLKLFKKMMTMMKRRRKKRKKRRKKKLKHSLLHLSQNQ